MAKVGFEYIVAAELDEETTTSLATLTYKNAREIGPGAKVSTSVSASNVKDYGDDRLLLTDTSFNSGTVTLELNEPTMDNEAWLLGHSTDDDHGVIYNEDDIAPFVGLGFVGKSRAEGSTAITYRAKIYTKVQFKDHSDEYDTKQESVSFTHTTIEGDMYRLNIDDSKSWKMEKEFTTLAAAKAYIQGILGLSAA